MKQPEFEFNEHFNSEMFRLKFLTIIFLFSAKRSSCARYSRSEGRNLEFDSQLNQTLKQPFFQ